MEELRRVLSELFPHNVLGCCVRNTCANKLAMMIWSETDFQAYLAGNNEGSRLNLISDDCVCYNGAELMEPCFTIRT